MMRDLYKMMRPECSYCGSGVTWMDAEDLEMKPGVSSANVREVLAEGAAGGDAWWCSNCHAWGIFGAVQMA